MKGTGIDLVREKQDLDLFLSKCLENMPPPVEPPRAEDLSGRDAGPESPIFEDGDKPAARPAVGGEKPAEGSVQGGPLIADAPGEAAPASVQSGGYETAPDGASADEPREASTESPTGEGFVEGPGENFDFEKSEWSAAPSDQDTGKEAETDQQPAAAPVQSHFGPGEDLVHPRPVRIIDGDLLLASNFETRQDPFSEAGSERAQDTPAPYVEHSSLRKPTRNFSERQRARKRAKLRRQLWALGIFFAFALAIQAMFWIHPRAGYRAVDWIAKKVPFAASYLNPGSGPGTATDSSPNVRQEIKPAGAGPSRPVQRKFSRD